MAELSHGLLDALAAAAEGGAEAFLQKRHGVWQRWSWPQVLAEAQDLALGLLDSGLVTGQTVAIVSAGRVEAVVSLYACQWAGLRPVLLHPALGPGMLATQCMQCDAAALIAEDQEQIDKIADLRSRLPGLTRLWVIDAKGVRLYRHVQAVEWNPTVARGHGLADRQGRLAALRQHTGRPAAAIGLFSAGVAAEPRLIELTSAGVLALCATVPSIPLQAGQRCAALFSLAEPLGHFFACVAPILFGTVTVFGEGRSLSARELRESAPAVVVAPARVLERWRRETIAHLERDASLSSRAALRWLGGRGGTASDLVFGAPLRRTLGLGDTRWLGCGAERLSVPSCAFYQRLGCNVIGIYALTEAGGPVALMAPADQSQLTLFANWAATASAADELRLDSASWAGDTGDQVAAAGGSLHLVGRAIDVLATPSGRQVSPGEVERQLATSPYIHQAVAVGGPATGITALIELDEVALRDWAQRHGLMLTTFRSFAEASGVHQLIATAVAEANQRLDAGLRIRQFIVLPRPLDPGNGELTASLGLRRTTIRNRYAHRLLAAQQE